jgi:hypothetical protein
MKTLSKDFDHDQFGIRPNTLHTLVFQLCHVLRLGYHTHNDCTFGFLQTSPLHSGEVRGICGDYNGESHREMSGPKRQQYQSAKEFVLSYVLPSDNCDVDALKTQHNIQPETGTCGAFPSTLSIIRLFTIRPICNN